MASAARGWSRCGLGTAPLGSTAGGPLWWGEQDRATSVRTVRTALDAEPLDDELAEVCAATGALPG